MVASAHLLPMIAVLLLWFASTGLVASAAHVLRPRSALIGGAALGLGGLALFMVSGRSASILAAYGSFVGALMIWAWLELAFLSGAVAGPERRALPDGVSGWRRFTMAARTLIHHELALAIVALLLLAIGLASRQPVGALAFALLFAMRLSTKLNIFAGVPNLNADLLPPQLAYLKSYFGPRRMTLLLPLSLMASGTLTVWLGLAAFALPAGASATGASLLLALAALGFLEHLFLALPMREATLWRWALPNAQEPEGTLNGL